MNGAAPKEEELGAAVEEAEDTGVDDIGGDA
jgi:hypothetical protein